MHKNVGGKIKKLSDIVLYVGIGCSVISGVAVMLPGRIMILLGLVVIAVGCFSSWIGSLLMYGFGQLVENSDKTVMLQKGENIELFYAATEKNSDKPSATADAATNLGKCDMCGKTNIPVSNCVIKDDLGTRYRNMCAECFQKFNH